MRDKAAQPKIKGHLQCGPRPRTGSSKSRRLAFAGSVLGGDSVRLD